MRQSKEFTGKKIEDAIAEGLKTLGLKQDDVDIKTISTGGFLKKARVQIFYGADIPETPKKVEEKPIEKQKPQKEKKPDRQAPKTDVKQAEVKKDAVEPPKKVEKVEKVQSEPQWGSAPVKLEPRVDVNFGKRKQVAQEPKQVAQAQPSAVSPKIEPKIEPKQAAPIVAKVATPEKCADTRRQDAPKAQNAVKQAPKPVVKTEKAPREEKKRVYVERESVEPTIEQIEIAKTFLVNLLDKMGIESVIETAIEDGLRINIVTEDSRVIGYRGEVLDAMQYLVSLSINSDTEKYVHVSLDGLGYRGKRKAILEGLAARMAEKAVKSDRKVSLEPMNSADRRVIHAVLAENDAIVSRSEGHEPMRHIVILPKKAK